MARVAQTHRPAGPSSRLARRGASPPRPRPSRGPTAAFYREVMRTLNAADLPFLVGGTYALGHYTGIVRPTKDLDLFVRRESLHRALAAIEAAGHRTEITHPHFLGKAYAGQQFVDVIFASGNGSCAVDDWWFAHAPHGTLFGVPVRYCPIEEMIWSKAYVMERERYDGHDVAHLFRAGAPWLDWQRLMARFGPHWRVLLVHLILFGFIYPGDRARVPEAILDDLVDRLRRESQTPADANLCRGTLLSRSQYLHDVQHLGFSDARVEPFGSMTIEQTALWTLAGQMEPRARPAARRPPPKRDRGHVESP